MKRTALFAALAASLSLIACSKPAPEATPAATPAATATAPAETPAATTTNEVTRDGMVGQFSGTLPCASCPGIDTRLTLAADGSYQLEETYKEQADGHFTSHGQWVMDEYDAIMLTPADSNDNSRVYKAIDANTLRQTGEDGLDAGESYTLRRS